MKENEPSKSVVDRKVEDHTNPSQGINYLFVIAIDTYKNCPKLYNCEKDARELIAVLTQQYDFELQNVQFLCNEAATESNIYTGFRKLAQSITDRDNVVIYFSGHGEYDAVFDEGYWVPVNAQLGAYEDYLPNSKIKTFLNGINSKHTFLIADSCFSGSLFAQFRSAAVASRLEMHPSRWGLTAGRNEVVSDGQQGDHSPFSDSLLYHLKTNTQPLGVATLCQRVIENVIAEADQTPLGETLKVKGHRGGQFFFYPKNIARQPTSVNPPATSSQSTTFTTRSTNPTTIPELVPLKPKETELQPINNKSSDVSSDWENRKLKRSYDGQGKVGFVDAQTGTVVIEYQFDKAFNFKAGVAFVSQQNKMALINKKGDFVVPFIINQSGIFRNGIAEIMVDRQLFKINTKGEVNYNGKLVKLQDVV